jgi:MinD superfamily P-loop ATPase
MSKPTEIVVVSGKGGTGKTIMASSLVSLASDKVTADCDVDAPDLHLLLHPTVLREEVFPGPHLARIDRLRCTACGRCAEVCRFGAVGKEAGPEDGVYFVDSLGCEGCGVCVWICPAGAIDIENSLGGKWFVSDTRFGKFAHAQLEPARENSGKLVTLVRREARLVAEKEGHGMVIIDGPPGIGCPVIASITGTDFAVVVTEPTLSGIHDLDRVLELTSHFGVPAGVIVNKYDLNEDMTRAIETRVSRRGALALGRIPFDEEVKHAIEAGTPVIEHSTGPASRALRVLGETILSEAARTQPARRGSKK